MYGIAGRQDAHDLLGVAIDYGYLAGITQRHREEVLDVAVVLRLRWPVFGLNQQVPALFHLHHAEFGRRRRFLLKEARDDVDLFIGQVAGTSPVRHTCGRTVSDERL